MSNTRRSFLKTSGLGLVPAMFPGLPAMAGDFNSGNFDPSSRFVKFYGDGELFEPKEYLEILDQLQIKGLIEKDRYGTGGSVEALEKEMARRTGKEKAIFLPSGTMANQLAIFLLSQQRSKVFVQDLSHVYRDEADAAQTVFGKRLVPLGMNASYFTAKELIAAVNDLPKQEVFDAGIGAVSIEHPVRRADGRMVPLEEIKAISAFCKSRQIPLHLDGARLFMASAWSGTSIQAYSQYFDTVYISLYKYLGAAAGAVLCGPAALINQVPHLIKVHGGAMYGNWTNAAMALHRLEGFENRLEKSIQVFNAFKAGVEQIKGVQITAYPDGTNIYSLTLPADTDAAAFQKKMRELHKIVLGRPDAAGKVQLTVNETLLYRRTEELISAFKDGLKD
ncbi:MAG: aminotransferase class I/II-fold pyridoxal phosphate-dependent enzyme [Flavipsychrobacter sp.]|jgi:threonine aldolase|nr:aminotransferase class I/II-fold pyridoxal phosphate-dependent enzyme [Flavipsychrobacter sp.]